MALLADFHSRIAPLIPMCPIPMMDQAIIDACIELCEKGSVLHVKLPAMQTAVGVEDVAVAAPANTAVSQITAVDVDGSRITPDLSVNFFPAMSGRPRYFAATRDALTMYPMPDAVYSVQAHAIVKPTRTAQSVDQALMDDWGDVVASGALYRLQSMPTAEWASPAGAKMNYEIFMAGINRAMIEFRRGKAQTELRVNHVWI